MFYCHKMNRMQSVFQRRLYCIAGYVYLREDEFDDYGMYNPKYLEYQENRPFRRFE